MRTRHAIFAIAAATVLVSLTACGGGGGSPFTSFTPPPPIVVTYNDPPGDAIAQNGGTAWDITQVQTTLTGSAGRPAGDLYDTITIAVTFAQDVSNALPAPGSVLNQGNQLGVLIGFNSDGNDATGTYGGCGLSGTLFEFNLDPGNLGRRADGGYNILGQNPAGQPTGSEATVSVNGRTITFTIQLAAVGVGGPNIPKLKVQVVAFNGVHPALNYPLPTDCAPDAGEIATGT